MRPHIVNYLLRDKLGWDSSDVKAEAPLVELRPYQTEAPDRPGAIPTAAQQLGLPTPPPTRPYPPIHPPPEYFTADIPREFYKILPNEWPYSGT